MNVDRTDWIHHHNFVNFFLWPVPAPLQPTLTLTSNILLLG